MADLPPKDPQAKKPYFLVLCSLDSGLNDGSRQDTGELQGATISSYTVTPQGGITKDSDNKSAVSIHGVSYAANTVITVWLSGGTDEEDYNVLFRYVLSDGREDDKTIRVMVRSQ